MCIVLRNKPRSPKRLSVYLTRLVLKPFNLKQMLKKLKKAKIRKEINYKNKTEIKNQIIFPTMTLIRI